MGWKPRFEIGYVAPVVGNGWTNREPAGGPGAVAEYATHRPSGENVAEGGNGERPVCPNVDLDKPNGEVL